MMFKKLLKWTAVGFIGLLMVSISIGYVAGKIYWGNHKPHAERHAKEFAGEMGITVKGVSCTNRDQDGDKYVSCALNLPNGQVQRIECVGAIPPWPVGPFTPNKGCKLPKFQAANPVVE